MLRLVSKVSRPISVGIVPYRRLYNKSSCFSPDNKPSSVGMVLDMLLNAGGRRIARFQFSSCDPPKSIITIQRYLPKVKLTSLVSLRNSAGMVPVSTLGERLKNFKLTSLEISGLMVPVILLAPVAMSPIYCQSPNNVV